jgi:hypothetical protein
MYAARAGSQQMELAGSAAVKNAGLLANAKLLDAGVTALRTVKT